MRWQQIVEIRRKRRQEEAERIAAEERKQEMARQRQVRRDEQKRKLTDLVALKQHEERMAEKRANDTTLAKNDDEF